MEKFKIWYRLKTRLLSGESASVNVKTVQQWKEEFLSLAIEYKANDFLIAIRLICFSNIMLKKTLAFKGEPCHGGKNSKERLIVLLYCNVDRSEKLKPIVTGGDVDVKADCLKKDQGL